MPLGVAAFCWLGEVELSSLDPGVNGCPPLSIVDAPSR